MSFEEENIETVQYTMHIYLDHAPQGFFSKFLMGGLKKKNHWSLSVNVGDNIGWGKLEKVP